MVVKYKTTLNLFLKISNSLFPIINYNYICTSNTVFYILEWKKTSVGHNQSIGIPQIKAQCETDF